jgi:hypothetical protein
VPLYAGHAAYRSTTLGKIFYTGNAIGRQLRLQCSDLNLSATLVLKFGSHVSQLESEIEAEQVANATIRPHGRRYYAATKEQISSEYSLALCHSTRILLGVGADRYDRC